MDGHMSEFQRFVQKRKKCSESRWNCQMGGQMESGVAGVGRQIQASQPILSSLIRQAHCSYAGCLIGSKRPVYTWSYMELHIATYSYMYIHAARCICMELDIYTRSYCIYKCIT